MLEAVMNLSKKRGELKSLDGELVGITKLSKGALDRMCALPSRSCLRADARVRARYVGSSAVSPI